ncbi:MAG: phage shock protein A [Sulfurimonas sp.]|jgi:phage shock protein A|uniref:PspA/IM30 family protein n=1 Tax=Sulfurimonas sp. TaxID=2022749 RepID=UPI0039E6C0F3
MSENITNRVSRLISGSINALVDAAESVSPEIVMKESIREIESAISEVRHELGKVIVLQHNVEVRIESEQEKFKELNDQIQVALKENREDLAEMAISKQMDIEAQLPVLKKSLENYFREIKELESYITALQAKNREMVDELQNFKQRKKSLQSATAQDSKIIDNVSKSAAAFNRVMGVNTTLSQHTDEAKLAELEALTRKNRIEERLNAIKANQE